MPNRGPLLHIPAALRGSKQEYKGAGAIIINLRLPSFVTAGWTVQLHSSSRLRSNDCTAVLRGHTFGLVDDDDRPSFE